MPELINAHFLEFASGLAATVAIWLIARLWDYAKSARLHLLWKLLLWLGALGEEVHVVARTRPLVLPYCAVRLGGLICATTLGVFTLLESSMPMLWGGQPIRAILFVLGLTSCGIAALQLTLLYALLAKIRSDQPNS